MYKEQKDELEAFLRLISHIKARIDYCRAPLDSIFAEYTDRQLERSGFIESALTMRPTDALAKCKRRLCLSDAQIDELMKFFTDLGCHTAAEESAHCEWASCSTPRDGSCRASRVCIAGLESSSEQWRRYCFYE